MAEKLHPDLINRILEQYESASVMITPDTRPGFLLNDFTAPVWFIRDGKKTRKVNGEWKGAISVSWDMLLSCGGNLLDPPFALLLQHLRLLLIAIIMSPGKATDTTATLKYFAFILKGLAEWLAASPEHLSRAMAEGLNALDRDAIEHFMWEYYHHGAGPSIWMACFDSFLRHQYADPTERLRVAAWETMQDPNLLTAIEDTVISAPQRTVPPLPEFKASFKQNVRIFTLTAEELLWSKKWLLMKGRFDDKGLLKLDYMADTINVDRDRLAAHSQIMRFYARQFENLADYRAFDFVGFREKIGHRQGTAYDSFSSRTTVNTMRVTYWRLEQLLLASRYCEGLSDENGLAAINLTDLDDRLKGAYGDRTPSMPVDVALYIYDKAIHWALHYTKPLVDYYLALMAHVIKHHQRATKVQSPGVASMLKARGYSGEYANWWEEAFHAVPVPMELDDLNIVQFYAWEEASMPRNADGSHPIAQKLRRTMTVEQAIRLNYACLTILSAAFSVRREDEIHGMTTRCLSYAPGDGAWIDFALCKRTLDNVRLGQKRPIPRFLFEALRQQARLAHALVDAYEITDPALAELLFLYPARKFGATDPDRRTRHTALDLFCDYIEVPVDEEQQRWYVRLHECRRFFALAFMWMFPGRSLEALSWFFGHGGPEETWRYVTESTPGKEMNEMIAHFSVNAVRREETMAANMLRDFALRHFNVEDMSLISDVSLQLYLEDLAEEHCYTIEPRTLREGDSSYEMVIVVYKEPKEFIDATS